MSETRDLSLAEKVETGVKHRWRKVSPALEACTLCMLARLPPDRDDATCTAHHFDPAAFLRAKGEQ